MWKYGRIGQYCLMEAMRFTVISSYKLFGSIRVSSLKDRLWIRGRSL